ncbi:SH3 domain-containing protein [Balneolaceae bacterium ANBcel3]|nr:SH3 domain-containing protein [Balneolaceae bacterium ANBcel3]
METTPYVVVHDHTSEYPDPICLKKGDLITVGEKHEGPEGWDHWYFCESPGQKAGWVPAQIIENVKEKKTRALEKYTARELTVRRGDLILGSKTLNGWIWCKRTDDPESGWVPLSCVREYHDK